MLTRSLRTNAMSSEVVGVTPSSPSPWLFVLVSGWKFRTSARVLLFQAMTDSSSLFVRGFLFSLGPLSCCPEFSPGPLSSPSGDRSDPIERPPDCYWNGKKSLNE